MWGLPQKQNARRAYKIRLCGHLRRYKKIVKKTYIIFNKFYDNNFSLFAPIRLGKKNSPKADTMPKTRIIFKYDSECYLPGFIKVEPYEENWNRAYFTTRSTFLSKY